MARINIEDEFWLDIGEVIEKIGNQDQAIGMALRFIRYSQERHKMGKLISEEDFQSKFHEALIPTFAKRTPSGIQAKGAEKHFAWLEQKIEAGIKGGKKSVAGRARDARGRLRQIENTPSDHQPSSSSSFSSSNSNSQINTLAQAPPTPNLVRVYCDLWKQRNGKSPDITAKAAGQLTRLSKELGFDRASVLIRIYFSMPDPVFIKRGYDVGTLILNIQAVGQFEANGKIVTKEMVTQIEKKVDKIQNTKQRRSIEELERERNMQLIGDGK